ncbi:MAG: hypothetical protein JRI66_12830 [Deltaproteobacteria bacterium]|nr:hypothetical protein [Deltaproteobacteria bacterium]
MLKILLLLLLTVPAIAGPVGPLGPHLVYDNLTPKEAELRRLADVYFPLSTWRNLLLPLWKT